MYGGVSTLGYVIMQGCGRMETRSYVLAVVDSGLPHLGCNLLYFIGRPWTLLCKNLLWFFLRRK